MGPYCIAGSVALQPADGKIVVAGTGTQSGTPVVGVARYDPITGALDPTFNGTGKVKTPIGSADAYGAALAIQPADGQLVVAGQAFNANHYRFALARYDD